MTRSGESLTALLDRLVGSTPNAIAAIELGPSGESARQATFAELRSGAESLALALHRGGVRPGDCIGVWLPNWLDAVIWEFAAARLGCAVLGINTRYNVHELAHLLALARPRCVAHPDEFLGIDFAQRLRGALDRIGSTTVDPPLVAVARREREVTDLGAFDVGGGVFASPPTVTGPDSGLPAPAPEAPVNYFTTSGSTGRPKLAVHDQGSVVRHARHGAAALEIGASDVMLCVLPLFGVFGFNSAMATVAAGATCLLEPVFDPHAGIDHMNTYRVTHTVGGDDLHGRLMDAWAERPKPLDSWRRAAIADFGGRSAEVAGWAEREFGVPVCGVYGSSEIFALSSVQPVNLPVAERVRGGGRLVSDESEVRACDVETGAICAAGEPGELQFRGYNVMSEYLNNPEANGACRTEDGWFRSGDLGNVGDRPGEFTYSCRMGDALRLHGFLVEPAEIEEFLAEHPSVDGVKVVGATKADGTGVAFAFVTPDPAALQPPVEEDLLSFCRKALARYKVPHRIRVLDSFPTTTGVNGAKIKKDTLRQWARESLD